MRLYKRGSIWWVDYADIGGRRVQRSLKIRDKVLARIAAGKIEERLERRRAGVDFPTVADAWAARIARCRAENAESTQARVLPILERLRQFFGSELTAHRAHQYVLERRGTAAVATINYELGLIRSMFPADERPRPLRERDVDAHAARRRYLTVEECQRLEAVCRGELRPLVRAMLRLGCRRGELLAVEWQDIDLKRGTVRLANLKTARSARTSHRTLPLHPDLVDDLEAARTARSARPWPWNGTPHALSRRLAYTAARAGLGVVTPHTLRRTFASLLLQAGAQMTAVRDLLGHSTITTTERSYAWLMPRQLEAALGLLRYGAAVAGTRGAPTEGEDSAGHGSDQAIADRPSRRGR